MTKKVHMPNLQAPFVDDSRKIPPAWAKHFREIAIHVNAEMAPGRIQPFHLLAADLLDATKFVQAGSTEGLGVGEYLGWAVCNGNNDTPDNQTMQFADGDWHYVGEAGEPAFVNSWVNYGTDKVRFKRDQSGDVRVEGLAKSGGLPTAIFTLPSGYAPQYAMRFACASNSAFGFMFVNTTGAVSAQTGSNVWFSLDGMRFKTATTPTNGFVDLMRV